MQNIFIIIASHKKYKAPHDEIYKMVEVGAENRENHFAKYKDNDGIENISTKNSSYCELTALYWAWKNVNYDIVGLVHYRRYFSKSYFSRLYNFKNIIDKKTINKLLKNNDFILPKTTKLKKTIYQHSIAHYNDGHMDLTRDVIKDISPDYLAAFDFVMAQKKGHFFNMFIAKKEIANKYLSWLFQILGEVEKRYVFCCKDPRSVRVFGYISESLLDVYIIKNHLSYSERSVVYLEAPNLFKRVLNKIKKFLIS